MSWQNKGYKISIDKLSEDKTQDVSCVSSVIVNKEISLKKYRQIKKILKEEK